MKQNSGRVPVASPQTNRCTPVVAQLKPGKYSMYTTGKGAGEKFHSFWVDAFFDEDESATVVIEPESP
jgi:hypothetical protein